MNQVNAIIVVDAERLNRPLTTLQARQFSSFVGRVLNCPENVENLFARIFKPTGGYYDIPASRNANGDWTFRAVGTCFGEAGRAKYELHATDADGNPTSFGSGRVCVAEFSNGGHAVTPGTQVSVAVLPDSTGALHQVVAVMVDGEWTWQLVER